MDDDEARGRKQEGMESRVRRISGGMNRSVENRSPGMERVTGQ